jgi:hypothetical protein
MVNKRILLCGGVVVCLTLAAWILLSNNYLGSATWKPSGFECELIKGGSDKNIRDKEGNVSVLFSPTNNVSQVEDGYAKDMAPLPQPETVDDPCSMCLANAMQNATRVPDTSALCIVARCPAQFHNAWFHRMHDCAVGYQRLVSIAGHLVANNRTVSLVVTEHSRGIIELMIEGWIEPPLRRKISLQQNSGVKCVDSTLWSNVWIPLKGNTLLVCRNCVLKTLLKAAAVPKKTTRSVLVISRSGTRKILDKDLLNRRLTGVAASNGFALTIYRGDESLAQTIRLFHSAAVVVGYHGAGLVNTIFSRNTLAIEVSTYLHPPQYSSKKWRTLKDAVAEWKTPLKWLTVWVDHEHLRPRPPTHHSQGMKFEWNHLVKGLDVDLGLANIDTIAEIVGNFLQSSREKGGKTSIQVLAMASNLSTALTVSTNS